MGHQASHATLEEVHMMFSAVRMGRQIRIVAVGPRANDATVKAVRIVFCIRVSNISSIFCLGSLLGGYFLKPSFEKYCTLNPICTIPWTRHARIGFCMIRRE